MIERISFAVFLLGVGGLVHAEDWPQWQGLRRDGVWREAGVVDAIPAGGLPVAWTADVAYGYAGPAVAEGRVFLFDFLLDSGDVANLPSRRDELVGQERLAAYDAATGELLWRESSPQTYTISYGGGPRCTPTVDGDRVYSLGAEGELSCRDVRSGELFWRTSFKADYGAETPIWGHSAHPLVMGELLVCVVGGAGSVAVAFDKRTGLEVWKNLSAGEPGYCPPTLIEHNGAQQLLIWHPESLNALVPGTGELIWSLPARPAYGMSIGAPQKLGDRLFISAIGKLSVLMKLRPDGSDVDVVWSGGGKTGMQTANMTAVMTPAAIFGVDCETSELMAVSLDDGERIWATKEPTLGDAKSRARHGTAFLVPHEPTGGPAGTTGRYFLFNEAGDLISARLTANGYQETGRQHLLEPTSSAFGRPVVWTHPAFANRCVYARNDKQLVCVSLAAE